MLLPPRLLTHPGTLRATLLAVALLALSARPASAQEHGHHHGISAAGDPVAGAVTDVVGMRLQTVDGELVHLGHSRGARPVALVFLNDGCTISRRYVPRLNELASRADEAGVELLAVISNPAISWQDARAFRDEYSLRLPLLFDANGDLARQVTPTVVPSAFVVDLEGRIVYRGRIDDRFPSLTKIREKATQHDLLEAMEAVAAGRVDSPVTTRAVGCVFSGWPETPEPPTYAANIAPILNAHCGECHTAGGVGPFALDSYDQARRWADMISSVTRRGIMPPWHAERGQGHFREERFLSGRQIAMLASWEQAGAPLGDPDALLPAPQFDTAAWPLGQPDLVLTMPEPFEVPSAGPDIYRYFVLPMEVARDQVVVAIDFQPGDAAVVHHCNFFVDYSGRGRKLDGEDPGPGFSVFGTGGFMSYDGANALGAWAPGVAPYQLPEGRGFDLPQGGDIILEVHYHLTGKPTRDQSSIAFYFADGPVERGVSGLMAGTQDVEIPAGEANYWRRVSMDVPASMRLVDIAPHMHYLGRESRVVATLPDGAELPLLHVTDWDLRWQGIYTYRKPLEIPAGSTITADFRFDNSSSNPANPFTPPQRVSWGWGSDEEMAEVYMTVITDDRDAEARLQASAQRSWMRSADPDLPSEPKHTDRQWLDRLLQAELWDADGEAMLTTLAGSSQFESVLELAERHAVEQRRDSRAFTVLGILLSIASYYGANEEEMWQIGTAADESLARALDLEKTNGSALLARASLYAESQDRGLMKRSERWFLRLLDPQRTKASVAQQAAGYVALGKLYEGLGQRDKAASTWRQGHRLFPDHPPLAEAIGRLPDGGDRSARAGA